MPKTLLTAPPDSASVFPANNRGQIRTWRLPDAQPGAPSTTLKQARPVRTGPAARRRTHTWLTPAALLIVVAATVLVFSGCGVAEDSDTGPHLGAAVTTTTTVERFEGVPPAEILEHCEIDVDVNMCVFMRPQNELFSEIGFDPYQDEWTPEIYELVGEAQMSAGCVSADQSWIDRHCSEWAEIEAEEGVGGVPFGMYVADADKDTFLQVLCVSGVVYVQLVSYTAIDRADAAVVYRFASQSEPTALFRVPGTGAAEILVLEDGRVVTLLDPAPFVAELADHDGDKLFVDVHQGWNGDIPKRVYSTAFDTSGALKAVESVTWNCL